MPTVLEQLKGIIAARLGIDAATIDAARPLDECGFDSLMLAELLFAVEDHFAIALPAAEPQQITTLGAIAQMVEAALQKETA